MKQLFVEKKFSLSSLELIDKANEFINDYQTQGLKLTLRQLYYRFVSSNIIKNKQQEYDRLGRVVNDGRLAGLIDWDAIEDRTRQLNSSAHFDNPADAIDSISWWYKIDKWANQPCRPEVWVEKEALAGVVEKACRPLDVGYLSCRGYMSQSEMYEAAQRHINYRIYGDTMQHTVIIHLGDHDPSGIDMTRDNWERMKLLSEDLFDERDIIRIALNMDQVDEYNPPPNFAKIKDSRASDYIRKYGENSWELDALEPEVLIDLIQDKIKSFRDETLWEAAIDEEKDQRNQIRKVSKNWDKVLETLQNKDD